MDRWNKSGAIAQWIAVVIALFEIWHHWPKSEGTSEVKAWLIPAALISALVLAAGLRVVAAIVSRGKTRRAEREGSGQSEYDKALIQSRERIATLDDELTKLQARDDECKQFLEVINEQAKHLSSLIQMEQALISSHNLLSEAPFVELRFLVKNCSVFQVSIPDIVGHLCFGNQQLENAPTFVGRPIQNLRFWQNGGFDLRQKLERHEALMILNSDRASFGFHRIEFPIIAMGTDEQENLYMNCEITSDKLIADYPKLEIAILASALREYRDLTKNTRFALPEHLESIVNVNLRFENPRPGRIEIKQYKLITYNDVARTTSAQAREIRERPAIGVSGEAQGLALPNLNDRTIHAEQREPFEGWLQFVVKVPPKSIHGTVAELVIVDTSGEEHRAKTRVLQLTED